MRVFFYVLLAQGCHAAIAAVIKNLDKQPTQAYLDNLESMYKVVLKAETDDQLEVLISKLEAQDIDHYVWTEQPENIRTCVASAPNDKARLQPLFRSFKLFN